jgi:hypothetical protein
MINKEVFNTLIEVIKNTPITPYEFDKDKYDYILTSHVWEILYNNQLEISVKENSKNELENVVKTIINQFKFLIENKDTNTLLWRNKSKPYNEKQTQKIFNIVAYIYCKANDIDISPEMDTGIGLVDFKFSKGYSNKIIVEIKHSTNANIISGYSTQLKLYMKSEETVQGFYVVIDFGGMGNNKKKLMDMYNAETGKKPEIIFIDARLKPSASKRKKADDDSWEYTEEYSLVSTDDTYLDFSNIELPNFDADIGNFFEDYKK